MSQSAQKQPAQGRKSTKVQGNTSQSVSSNWTSQRGNPNGTGRPRRTPPSQAESSQRQDAPKKRAPRKVRLVNAWILLNEDPENKHYDDPTSAYSRLKQEEVYRYVDILFVCFFTTVETETGWSIAMDHYKHDDKEPSKLIVHPGNLSNSDYLARIVHDARAINPRIRIVPTLNWNPVDVFERIFTDNSDDDERCAREFATNTAKFIKEYGFDGLDIDWELDSCDRITESQCGLLLRALRKAFEDLQDKHYLLTLSPAYNDRLHYDAVNECVDFVNLQLYSDFTKVEQFTGIDKAKLACGVKFESASETVFAPKQTVKQAVDSCKSGDYTIVTQWRLNSGNYNVEQDYQKQLYTILKGKPITRKEILERPRRTGQDKKYRNPGF